MLIVTTNDVADSDILDVLGPVYGEVIEGITCANDIGTGIKNLIKGTQTKGYEQAFTLARERALSMMEKSAEELHANAIIGLRIAVATTGEQNRFVIITCSGTAVRIR